MRLDEYGWVLKYALRSDNWENSNLPFKRLVKMDLKTIVEEDVVLTIYLHNEPVFDMDFQKTYDCEEIDTVDFCSYLILSRFNYGGIFNGHSRFDFNFSRFKCRAEMSSSPSLVILKELLREGVLFEDVQLGLSEIVSRMEECIEDI